MATKTGTTKMSDVRSSAKPATDGTDGKKVVHSATTDRIENKADQRTDGNQVRHLNRQIVEDWLDTISPAEAQKVADYAEKVAG